MKKLFSLDDIEDEKLRALFEASLAKIEKKDESVRKNITSKFSNETKIKLRNLSSRDLQKLSNVIDTMIDDLIDSIDKQKPVEPDTNTLPCLDIDAPPFVEFSDIQH